MKLIDDISDFLGRHGFEVTHQTYGGFEIIRTSTYGADHEKVILPLEICAGSEEEAQRMGDAAAMCVESICRQEGYPLIITEDSWRSQGGMTKARLLAHLEVFHQAYARNCEVRRIEKAEAQEFLEKHHSYGSAACRYRYGLYLKRYTGHGATSGSSAVASESPAPVPGTLVAVATFSNARKWIKGDKEIRSYEWTRYASLPGLRINGGMGKLLKAFIEEVRPDDIMSYADLEWSEGDVYRQLGFTLEGRKDPVTFTVDTGTWKRFPVKPGMTIGIRSGMTGPDGEGMTDGIRSGMAGPDGEGMTGHVIAETADNVIARPEGSWQSLYFRNFGSNKYRLKLTAYE